MKGTSVRRVGDRFPTGVAHAVTGEWVCGWARAYPAGCDVRDATDHLAVGSGANARYAADPDRFELKGGRWVEDLGGVAFADVDPDYLQYILSLEAPRGRVETVQRWVAAWTRTPEGRARFSDTVWPGRETGWMYRTLGSLAYHRARRDRDDVLAESGFCPGDDAPDDGWYAGRSWGSADPDWAPERHAAYAVLERVRGGGTGLAYESKRAGEYTRASVILVSDATGAKAFELPGRWLPEHTGSGLEFVDRHAWDATLWAAGELRDLYTRVVENGELCVPDPDPTDRWERLYEGVNVRTIEPKAWVYETVDGVMALVPRDHRDGRLVRLIGEVRKMANACLDAADKMGVPVAETPDLGRLFDLVDAETDTRRRSLGVRVTRRGDCAMCEVLS